MVDADIAPLIPATELLQHCFMSQAHLGRAIGPSALALAKKLAALPRIPVSGETGNSSAQIHDA